MKHMEQAPIPTVHRLASEVLSIIFRISVAIDPPTCIWTSRRPNIFDGIKLCPHRWLGSIHVSHVCRRWRGTAVGDAALWTSISGNLSMRWVTEMLSRSRCMPIDVSFDQGNLVQFLEVALAPEQRLRLKTFRLCPISAPIDFMLGLGGKPDQPTPLLEEVVIDGRFQIGPSDVIFPSTLPRLRKLSLRGCRPPSWDKPFPCNLTALTLEYDGSEWTPSLTSSEWLDILGHCPKLETVEAIGIMEESLEDDIHHQPVALPCLTQIVIGWRISRRLNANRIHVLLHHLLLPSACVVKLEFDRCNIQAPSDIETILTLFAGHASTYDPCRGLATSADARKSPKTLVLTSTHGEMHLSLVDKAAFSVKWVRTESDVHFMVLLQAVYEKLDLPDITFLKISGNFWGFTRINRDTLQLFLSSFPSVKTLTLSQSPSAAIIISHLAGFAGGSGPWESEAVQDNTQLPALETLVLERVNLDEMYGWSIRQQVVKMMQSRRSLGAEIMNVELMDCQGSEESMNSIKKSISNFVVVRNHRY